MFQEGEDEAVAYLDHDGDNEVDLSALPDPDKYRDMEEDEQPVEESSRYVFGMFNLVAAISEHGRLQ